MDDALRKVVEQIFSNWTALQLAVEHSMGGPQSKQIALKSIDYVVQYLCNNADLEVEDIEDYLDDIMDQEFNVVCEDNSIQEVSQHLFKFRTLFKEGKNEEAENEFKKLPIAKKWISQPKPAHAPIPINSIQEEPSSSHTPMEEEVDAESEWTEVKSRKKR